MFVANIEWPKVKLTYHRLHAHQYDIFRDGERVARVQQIRGKWKVARRFVPRTSTVGAHDAWAPVDWVERSSWRTAALEGARDRGYGTMGRVQQYGQCHAARVQIDTVWYTVITEIRKASPKAAPGHRAPDPDPPRQYIFEDHPDSLRKPKPATAVRIRRSLAEASSSFAVL